MGVPAPIVLERRQPTASALPGRVDGSIHRRGRPGASGALHPTGASAARLGHRLIRDRARRGGARRMRERGRPAPTTKARPTPPAWGESRLGVGQGAVVRRPAGSRPPPNLTASSPSMRGGHGSHGCRRRQAAWAQAAGHAGSETGGVTRAHARANDGLSDKTAQRGQDGGAHPRRFTPGPVYRQPRHKLEGERGPGDRARARRRGPKGWRRAIGRAPAARVPPGDRGAADHASGAALHGRGRAWKGPSRPAHARAPGEGHAGVISHQRVWRVQSGSHSEKKLKKLSTSRLEPLLLVY